MLLVILPGKAYGVFKKSFFVMIQDDYNDNIFLASDREQKDFVIRQNLGLSLFKMMPRYDLSLDYAFEAKLYNEFTEANNERHTVGAESHLELIKNVLFFDVEESFTRIPSDIRRPALAEDVDVNLLDTNNIKVSLYVSRDIGTRTSLKAGYTYTDTEYNSNAASDTNYNIIYESLERKFSPRLTSSIDHEYQQKFTDGLTEDFELHKASVSATYKPGSAITLKARAGNGWFNFETRGNDEQLFWSLDMESLFKKGEGITLHYGSDFIDSPERGIYKSEEAYLSFFYGLKMKFTGKLVFRRDDYLETDRNDRINRGEMGLFWQVAPKISLFVNGYRAYEVFDPQDENISTWGAETKASYELNRLLTLEARYRHTDRDSDLQSSSFINNIYTLSLRASR